MDYGDLMGKNPWNPLENGGFNGNNVGKTMP